MATQRDARRIALSPPDVVEDRFAVGIPLKGKVKHFIWEWFERVDPKKARVPNEKVLVLRVRARNGGGAAGDEGHPSRKKATSTNPLPLQE